MRTLYLLDTNIMTLWIEGSNPTLAERLHVAPGGDIYVSVITAEEQLTGWLAFIRKAKTPEMVAYGYEWFAHTLAAYGSRPTFGFSAAAQARYQTLRATVKNVGGNDLRIAAMICESRRLRSTRALRWLRAIFGISSAFRVS